MSRVGRQFTAEQAHAAVARGAAWLDNECPGWELEIDLAKLDIASGAMCLLGQTAHCVTKGDVQSRQFDSFYATLSWITRAAEPGRWATEHGFLTPPADHERERATAYEMLRIAWSVLIRERLAVPAHV
jgi:hypothetical protein